MALAKFVNHFLLGADPELVLLDPPDLHRTNGAGHDETGYFGYDHGGYVLEPQPVPDFSARVVCNNIKKSLDYMLYKYPSFKFRAGAYINSPQRHVTLGGHVHLDMQTLSRHQIQAMDIFTDSLVGLDILPRQECQRRCESGEGYGRKGDIRAEHGHVEYRSMCSWLFSRKTSMLAITGIKLCAVAPQTLPTKPMDSIEALTGWLEGFKSEDDDARWILERGYFDNPMEADPDANITSVWKTSAERGKELRDQFIAAQVMKKKQAIRLNVEFRTAQGGLMTAEQIRQLRDRLDRHNGRLVDANF